MLAFKSPLSFASPHIPARISTEMRARENTILAFAALLSLLLPCSGAHYDAEFMEYRCDVEYNDVQFKIFCTGRDDSIVHVEYKVDGKVYVPLGDFDSQTLVFPNPAGCESTSDVFLRLTFASGVNATFFNHPNYGELLRLAGDLNTFCKIEVGDEIVITCSAEGMILTDLRYTVNGDTTQVDLEDVDDAAVIRIPLDHDSLKIGENTISVFATEANILTSVLTFQVEVSPAEGGSVEVSCETDYCEEGLTLSVRCTASTAPVTVTCYYDDQTHPSHPCGLEFEIDVTKYTPGPHKVKVEVHDPATHTISASWIPFFGTSAQCNGGFDLCFVKDTPRVRGGEVYAEFAAKKIRLEFTCHLTGYSHLYLLPPYDPEDCSDGNFHKIGLSPGHYSLKVIAHDPEGGEEEEIEGVFYVHSRLPGYPYCSIHLINCGWRQEGGSLTVEFAGTGLASRACAEFECCLDNNCQKCLSPFVTDLRPGDNLVKITPLGCGQHFLPWEKTFVV